MGKKVEQLQKVTANLQSGLKRIGDVVEKTVTTSVKEAKDLFEAVRDGINEELTAGTKLKS